MSKIIATCFPLALAVALFVFLSSVFQSQPIEADWRADAIAEVTLLSVIDVTATQNSAVILKPMNAKGIFISLVIANAAGALLIDVDLQVYRTAADDYIFWFANLPSIDGITADGSYEMVFGQHNAAGEDYAAGLEDAAGLLPTRFRFVIDSNNAVEFDATLYYQWLY